MLGVESLSRIGLEYAYKKKGLEMPEENSQNLLNQLAQTDTSVANKLKELQKDIKKEKKNEQAANWVSGRERVVKPSKSSSGLNAIGENILFNAGRALGDILQAPINQGVERNKQIAELTAKAYEKAGVENQNVQDWVTQANQKLNERTAYNIAAYNAQQQEQADIYNRAGFGKVGNTVLEATGALGYMAPMVIGGAATRGAAFKPLLGSAAYNSAFQQALAEGADVEQASNYGTLNALNQVGTEALFGGLGKIAGKGVLDKALKMQPNNSLRNVILNTAKGAAGEGAEEALSGAIDPFLQRATYNPEAENATLGDLAYQAAIGAALGGLLGGGSNVVDYGLSRNATRTQQNAAQQAQTQERTNATTAESDQLKGVVEQPTMGVNQEARVNVSENVDNYNPDSHIENRSSADVGNRKINASQYDNPSVRPYIQAGAQTILNDLSNSQKPTRGLIRNAPGENGEYMAWGTKRVTSPEIASLLDDAKMTYAQIEKGAKDLIEDEGKENNANAKRVELAIDQMLSYGSTDATGEYAIRPNADYIREKTKINGAIPQDQGYNQNLQAWLNGELDYINENPRGFARNMYDIAERMGHRISEEEAAELEQLQRMIDEDSYNHREDFRYDFSEEDIKRLINEHMQAWGYGQQQADVQTESVTETAPESEMQKVKKEQIPLEFRRFVDKATSGNVGLKKEYAILPDNVNGYIKDNTIYINANKTNDILNAKRIVAHEIYHTFENTQEGQDIYRLALENSGINEADLLQAKKDAYAGVTQLDDAGARAEVAADFIEKAMTDEATINRILTTKPNFAQRILQAIKNFIAAYKAKRNMTDAEKAEYNRLVNAQKLYEQGIRKLQSGEYQTNSNARYNLQSEQTSTPEFKNWFGNSKVVDEQGKPKVVYSGHGNTNLFGSKFDPKKATSGGFYFTENPEIASNYAQDKFGIKEYFENGDEYRIKNKSGQYKLKLKDIRLTDEQAQKIDDFLMDNLGTTYADIVKQHSGYDARYRYLAYTGGKHNLANIYWIMNELGYTLSNRGYELDGVEYYRSGFEEVMNEMGIDWDSYTKKSGGVFPLYLSIKNPIDTSKEFPQEVMQRLERIASKEKRMSQDELDYTHWTSNYPVYEWINDIKEMQATGKETYWATQIPTKARKVMLEMGYDGIKDVGGKTGGAEHTVWIAFKPEQVKSAIANKGTFDPTKKDIRYSLSDMINQYGAKKQGAEPRRDVEYPEATSDFDKTRSFARTVYETEGLNEKVYQGIEENLESDIQNGRFTYEPTSNERNINAANRNISKKGYEDAYTTIKSKFNNDDRFTAEDIATGEMLLKQASEKGDVDKAIDLVGMLSVIGTEYGQTIQAMSLLKRMTPEGRLKQLEGMRKRLESKYPQADIKPLDRKDVEVLLNQKSDVGIDEQAAYMMAKMAEDLPASIWDKLNAWRYLAMLGNPRTHIRNTVGNALHFGMLGMKNQVAAAIEKAALPEGERSRSFGIANKELRDFAKQNYQESGQYLLGNKSKYDTNQTDGRQIFKTKVLETARKTNENLMEFEDNVTKQMGYQLAFANYMKANNYTPEMVQNNKALREKIEAHAADNARRVTFQEASALANALSRFENRTAKSRTEKVAQMAVGAVVPFKRTPINILKEGARFSPAGLIKGLSTDLYDMKQGKISANQVIDDIATGLTGTSILAIGYFLAEMGLLTIGYDSEEARKQNYQSQLGVQNYAFVLPGGGTYTIDWTAPAAMPLLAGAELANGEDGEVGLQRVLNALYNLTNPVLEMSMMQGIQDALQSYSSGAEGIAGSIQSGISGYAGQFVPTLLGQIARTVDETKRSTYAPKDSPITQSGEKLLRTTANKLPGVSMTSEASIDVWGRERQQEGENVITRALNQMLSPGTYASNKSTFVDDEINRLYNAVGEDKVIPKSAEKYVRYDNETYQLSAKDYTAFQKTMGQGNYKDLEKLVKTDVYTSMDDAEKAAAIQKIYNYNLYKATSEYLKKKGVTYTNSNYDGMKEKLDTVGGWKNYFELEQAFPDVNFDTALKYKEKCDQYNIDYTAYAQSQPAIKMAKNNNSSIENSSQKTEANKRDVAKVLSELNLTDPQRQVIWADEYTSESYKSVANRYGY